MSRTMYQIFSSFLIVCCYFTCLKDLEKNRENMGSSENIGHTAQKMKFSIKDFSIFLRIWSQLLQKPSLENFIFCTVSSSTRSYAITNTYFYFCSWFNSIFKIISSFWLMVNRYVTLIIPNDNFKKVKKSLRLSMTSYIQTELSIT